jgi:hypothetical protein
VEDTLEKTQLHEDLLEAGLLNILNAWLRPLADGSIPNVSVRTTLLRLLKKLPVNVEMFDRREQLKKSGLGKVRFHPLARTRLDRKRNTTRSGRGRLLSPLRSAWPVQSSTVRFRHPSPLLAAITRNTLLWGWGGVQMVMFLYKLPEETLQNKRVAQALVEAWSRPIFELSTQYSDLKHLQRREVRASPQRE